MTWRIGSVPHLNARPLIYGLSEPVALHRPAQLADLMHRREIDVALAPVAEVLLHDQYDILDNIAVASHGPVRSVFLAHRVPVEQIRRVAVDPASRSSAWLVRVILRYRYGVLPEFYPRKNGATVEEPEAVMLFGDEAICFAAQPTGPAVDLGAAWAELTGLPFVYAVWAAQRGAADDALINRLRQAKADGLAHVEDVVQSSTEATPELRREYLTRCIQYDLGAAEKQGVRKFQQYLQEMNLVETHDLRYVG